TGALPISVACRLGEGVGGVVVGGGGVGERAVGVERQGAVRWAGGDGGGERAAVGVAVVAEHPGGGPRQRRVLGGAVGVVSGGRGVVDGGDGDRHGCGVGLGGAVAGPVGEGIGAVEVGAPRGGESCEGVRV